MVALLALPFGLVPALAGGLVTGAGLTVGLLRGSAVVEVSSDTLRAGRARIGVELLGPATALDREATRRGMGPELDARAFVLSRPWVHTAVRVVVEDAADPAPYWFVATRHPLALAAALEEARPGRGPQAAHSEQTS